MSDNLQAPQIDPQFIPNHIALVMDGNGRWATQRGLKRTEGHQRGEAVLLDMVSACLALGVKNLSAYAFSTENWRRSVEEVRFLMGFNRDVLSRQKMWLHERGVRVRWVGRRPRLWRSVINELEAAEELTKNNEAMTLYMCVNYGGRAEIVDGVRDIARKVQQGLLDPEDITEKNFHIFLDEPDMPDVDLFLRPSGEKRTSNFLLWQSAYAEMVYQHKLFPDYTPADLFDAVIEYAHRDRRFGGVK
ncbi:isoprenyl transferase [Corynebacterium sp. ES2730-CONJ]|uniref:isoprenyl transferase n=1 Tax=Corynebacterium sp. ES2730-CONJ TaxID=2973941 RepID=UPI00216B33EA|nr:isoprenyl transferase [Corynebacterium sp. ES2730-CONJ]MCS4532442.1 isoprenyl transferase [Corynebacterium sp. ES2730-CONJ]